MKFTIMAKGLWRVVDDFEVKTKDERKILEYTNPKDNSTVTIEGM